eukprot:scaffold47492_cov71-Attheya_sp.AAC.4
MMRGKYMNSSGAGFTLDKSECIVDVCITNTNTIPGKSCMTPPPLSRDGAHASREQTGKKKK